MFLFLFLATSGHGKSKGSKTEKPVEADEDDDLFGGEFLSLIRDEANSEDRTLPQENQESRLDEEAWSRLSNRFVTGTWDATEDAQALLDADGAF